jgi:peptide-methionine (R)-S-oxide reductase
MKTNSQECGSSPVNLERRRLLQVISATLGVTALGAGLWAPTANAADIAQVRIVQFDNDGKRLGEKLLPKVVKSDAEWRRLLSPLSYEVTRENGTERAFSGAYKDKPAVAGIYRCICCGTALFNANTQFHSGTGWPSFWQPIAQENVRELVDTSFLMRRTAVSCARCDAHLGHVFPDGPPPTGLRYCTDSVALKFDPAGVVSRSLQKQPMG